ncbi:conserved domain protein [Bacteroides fluxus YIT 12057]|uniref:Conserved domain protein n=1 Tax=Bacteroides fluxus YIT 12057 TaxID=763034 RepID=F3PP90_9BACE|nr:conserved domain protein [Bacteroides fluxus YIT 12057]
MGGTVAAESCIVIGGNGVNQAFVCVGMLAGKDEALFNDGLYMREVMCLVKTFVAGNDFGFDIGNQGLRYHVYILLRCKDN